MDFFMVIFSCECKAGDLVMGCSCFINLYPYGIPKMKKITLSIWMKHNQSDLILLDESAA